MNLRLLLAGATAAALMSTSAQAANIFYQSFTNGLGANEKVGGTFVVKNGQVGHANGYSRFDYSYYDLALDLTGVIDAQLLFDYDIQSEFRYDGLNVLASTTGVFNPPAGLLTPISTDFYGPLGNRLPKLGSVAVTGVKKGTALFDLTQFAGQTVDLRFQFEADHFADGRGIRLDNILVNGTPDPSAAPEPSAWAMMILGFGAAGSILRRRRGALA